MESAERLKRIYERQQIVDVVLRFAHSLDVQDWKMLRDCLSDQILIDYSDFRGEPPAMITAEEFVEKRIIGLNNLKTQHISTNHLVTVENDRAECTSVFLIHRVNPNLPPECNFLDTAGHYFHGFRRFADGWVIDKIVQTVIWSRGSSDVHGAFR